MRIAVIGAGFAGLATVWHLLQRKEKGIDSVTLFDASGIGAGASGAATGLLNVYMGPHAKPAWPGKEGFNATLELLQVSSKAFGQLVYNRTPIFRPALSLEQEAVFKGRAALFPEDLHFLEYPAVRDKIEIIKQGLNGLWIPEGIIVQAEEYLRGLWVACERLGAHLEKKRIHSIYDVKEYDRVIFTAGYGTKYIEGLSHLDLRETKGQSLLINWPKNIRKPTCAINGRKYLIPGKEGGPAYFGATYERQFKNSLPNVEVALQELQVELNRMVDNFGALDILSCKSGIRIAGPQAHAPIVENVNEKYTVFTGLGSKGLLLHALLAKKIVSSILFPNNAE